MLEVENHEEPSYMARLPKFQYSSNLTGVPYLSDFDIDEQLPQTIDHAILLCSNLVPSDTILAIFPFFIQM